MMEIIATGLCALLLIFLIGGIILDVAQQRLEDAGASLDTPSDEA